MRVLGQASRLDHLSSPPVTGQRERTQGARHRVHFLDTGGFSAHEGRRMTFIPAKTKVGAECPNWARSDLSGGVYPTAHESPKRLPIG